MADDENGNADNNNKPEKSPNENEKSEPGDNLLEYVPDFNKTEFSQVEWDENRYVWDLTQLTQLNKDRKRNGEPLIEIVKKHSEVDLGIRAHTNFTFGSSLMSIFMIDHNEFIFIWLYIGFAAYYWYQFGLLLLNDGSYGFKQEENYMFMQAATLILALSLTVSLIYLIFYSISKHWEKSLSQLDVSIKYLNVFSLMLTFLIAEYTQSKLEVGSGISILEFYVYLTLAVSLIVIILIQYQSLRTAMWWITFSYLLIIFVVDQFFCSDEVFLVLYVPFMITLGVLSFVSICYLFQIPERWCQEARIFQLYFQSHLWLSLAYLLVLYFFHLGLYKMFKINESNAAIKDQQQQSS